jgi:uncharacterized protein (DUF433 family)
VQLRRPGIGLDTFLPPQSAASLLPKTLANECKLHYSTTDMKREELLSRISVDPNVCFGKACIRGTRIWVSLILENLAEGMSEADLIKAYPQLKPDDVRAALAYAAETTREQIMPLDLVRA